MTLGDHSYDHRWIGEVVEDTTTGARGVFRALAPDGGKQKVAWLRPLGGGPEFTADPDNLAKPEPGDIPSS
ncbi:hypothetical protein [Streptomyces sp. NPDC020983]|uniref:hypothetical protein n=1 Tax=Streptomyces sp. NPDC020983 TaxID=3365106 RepID=UPI00378DA5C4